MATSEHEMRLREHGLLLAGGGRVDVDEVPGPVSSEVCEGVAFLNREYPEWLGAIDLDGLDLDDAVSCVAGQVAGEYLVASVGGPGDYWSMLREWGGVRSLDREAWAIEHGFLTATGGGDDDESRELGRKWERVIVDLRADDGGDLCGDGAV